MRGPAILNVQQRSSASCRTHYTVRHKTAGGQLPAANGSSASTRNSSSESLSRGSWRKVNRTRTLAAAMPARKIADVAGLA